MSDTASHPDYEIVIEPARGWLNLRWREFWEYRDLLVILIQRDFTSRYKQTLLGPLWFIVQPLLQTVVFAIVFGRVAGLPTDGVPGPLFYLCGLLGWNYFTQNVNTSGATFINNSHLFGKVWFPRLIVPVSAILSNLVALALQAVPLLGFYLYYKCIAHSAPLVQPDWRVLLVLLPILQLALLSLGVSLWISASTATYRDLVHLTQFLIQLWMFATPVIIPLSQGRTRWGWIFVLNPASAPVEATRICLLGRGSLLPGELALSLGLTVLILISGLALFQKVERTAVDSV